MIVSTHDFNLFINKITNSTIGFNDVIMPYATNVNENKERTYTYKKNNGTFDYVLSSYRTVDPLKILFYFSREKVYPVKPNSSKRVILGVKACDLKALQLLDKALLQSGFADPSYKVWRDNSTIISSDCHEIHTTCNCNTVGGKPFAEIGFDVNISQLNGYIHLTVGSSRGEDFVTLMKKDFKVTESTQGDIADVNNLRSRTEKLLSQKNNTENKLDSAELMRNVGKDLWEEESAECVGCGACTNICPTCYCLILNDESSSEEFVKVRSYDSCQWHGYARVAGGGTPRPKMTERFRNRYLCKFDYMKKNLGEIGCTGCGRCTEACAGQIKFMEVVKKLSTTIFETVS